MIRQSVIFVVLAALLGTTGDLRAAFVNDAARAEYMGACRYYEARSEHPRQAASRELMTFLVQVCGAAQDSLDGETEAERIRAVDLLHRVTELRQTVRRMNLERDSQAEPLLPRVTPSGEFLIAHRMGLLDAFDTWLDTGVEFSLASYP